MHRFVVFTRFVGIAFVGVAFAGNAAVAVADPSACLGCHSASEFAELDVATTQEALSDPGIPPHGPFADLSEEEVRALLESLKQ